MAKNKKNQEVEESLHMDEALSKSERFIEEHQKPIMWVLCGVIVIAAAIVLFRTQYLAPKNVDAANKIAQCVYYFEQDSFALALNGDGINEGFADIANGYKFTKSRNLACFYSAICCYKLGQYEDALDYIQRFETKSVNANPSAMIFEGDCYVALDQIAKAEECFRKAAEIENVATAPRALNKLAICYEYDKNYSGAKECYQTIKDKYFDTQLAMDMDKRIESCNIAMGK